MKKQHKKVKLNSKTCNNLDYDELLQDENDELEEEMLNFEISDEDGLLNGSEESENGDRDWGKKKKTFYNADKGGDRVKRETKK